MTTVYLPSTIQFIYSYAFPNALKISDVYYNGTFAQWSKVGVLVDNDSLMDAQWHYNDDHSSVVYGICGTDVSWELDKESGNLTLYGSGPTYGFDGGYSPFYIHRKLIKTVTISDQITEINGSAFYICPNITDVYYEGTEFQWNNNLVIEPGNEPILNATLHFKEVTPEETTTVPEETTTAPEETTTVPEESTTVPETTTAIPETTTAIPETTTMGTVGTTVMPDSTTAMPESTTSMPEPTTTPDPNDPANNSGVCGNDMTWTLVNGVLTISGTGDMWSSVRFREGINTVIIEEGIESINIDGFVHCYDLTEFCVDENNQFMSSENGVLYDKNKNVLLQYPTGRYENLYQMPDSVTEIGELAFSWCQYICNIELSDNLMTIAEDAFEGYMSASSISIDENNQFFATEDGVLYNKDKTELIRYPSGKTGAEFVVPEGVRVIASHAVQFCPDFRLVVLPESIEEIETLGFNLTNVYSIYVPENLKVIGSAAFYNAFAVNTVYYAGNENQWENIDFCDASNNNIRMTKVFYNSQRPDENYPATSGMCGDNLSWVIKDDGTLVISGTGDMWSYDYEKAPWFDFRGFIKNVVIEKGVTSIGSNAFYCCGNIGTLTIPESLTTIEPSAFTEYLFIWEVYYEGSENQWNEINIGADNECLTGNDYLIYTVMYYNYVYGHAHEYNAVVTAPTCTSQGFTTYTCSCGDTYIDDYTAETDHKDADGDFSCDYGCGYEFEKQTESDTPDETAKENTFFEILKEIINKIIEWLKNLLS